MRKRLRPEWPAAPEGIPFPCPAACSRHDRRSCDSRHPHDPIILRMASLVIAALSTLVQLFPIGNRHGFAIGSGLPINMGVSFAFLPTMQAIGDYSTTTGGAMNLQLAGRELQNGIYGISHMFGSADHHCSVCYGWCHHFRLRFHFHDRETRMMLCFPVILYLGHLRFAEQKTILCQSATGVLTILFSGVTIELIITNSDSGGKDQP